MPKNTVKPAGILPDVLKPSSDAELGFKDDRIAEFISRRYLKATQNKSTCRCKSLNLFCHGFSTRPLCRCFYRPPKYGAHQRFRSFLLAQFDFLKR